MDIIQTVAQWMKEKRIDLAEMERRALLDHKIIEAICEGRYTPSPQQRLRVAGALGVAPDQIAWGHMNPVSHLYGHGTQFGRSP